MVTYRNTRGRNGGSRVTLYFSSCLVLRRVDGIREFPRNWNPPDLFFSAEAFVLQRYFANRETVLLSFFCTRFIYPRSFFPDVYNVLINLWDVFGEWRWFSMDWNKRKIWLTQKCWLKLIYWAIFLWICINVICSYVRS